LENTKVQRVSRFQNIKQHGGYWVSAFRPKTLTAAVVPIIAGTALVKALGYPVLWWISSLALLASLFIQIGTNLVNDAMDFKKGADKETRLGPRRVTQAGIFSGRAVLAGGGLCFALAIACGIPLVVHGGWPIVLIGLVSVACGYAYTSGPFPLAYQGLGDLFVILFFGVIAVAGLVFLQIHEWRWEALILGIQVGFHCTVLIVVNNLRDVNEDRLVNKKTLPVRFGVRFAKNEIALLSLIPFLLLLYWVELGFYWTLLSLVVLPLAIRLLVNIFKTEPSPLYNQFLAKSALIHILFAIVLSLGLLL
jgi:1,4-dihydroxy-2-naphthoate octaprenyltransferase